MEITWQVENWQLSPSWDPVSLLESPSDSLVTRVSAYLAKGVFATGPLHKTMFLSSLGPNSHSTERNCGQRYAATVLRDDSEMITEVSRIYEENPGILVNIKIAGKLAFIPPKLQCLQCNRHTHPNMIDIYVWWHPTALVSHAQTKTKQRLKMSSFDKPPEHISMIR